MDSLQIERLPDVLTPVEASKLLRVGRNRGYELIREGRLRAVRVGRKLLVPKAAVIALLAEGLGG